MLIRLRLLTLVLDALLLVGAFSLAYFVRVGFVFSSDFPFRPYFWASLLASAAWVASLVVFRGYNPQVRFNRWIHVVKVIVAGLTGTALFGLIYYFGQKALFSRLLLIYIFVFGTLMMLLFHRLMLMVERRLIRQGKGIIRVLIIGSNRGVKRFIKRLQKNHSPYVPVAILDGYGTSQKELHGVPVLGKLNKLEKVIDEQEIQAIIQGDNIEQVVNILHFCQQHRLDYYLLPYVLGVYRDDLRVHLLEQPLITPNGLRKRSFWERLLS